MKKVLFIIAVIITVLFIAGCGKKDKKKHNPDGGLRGENTPEITVIG